MAAPKPIIKQEENVFQTLKKILSDAQISTAFCDIVLDGENCYSLKDKNQQEFYLISKKSMQSLVESAKKLEREQYLFRLEQEVYKSMPIDFEDVWCIALKEAKNYKKEPKLIVKNLKKRYPYLFLTFLNQLDTTDNI